MKIIKEAKIHKMSQKFEVVEKLMFFFFENFAKMLKIKNFQKMLLLQLFTKLSLFQINYNNLFDIVTIYNI